MRIIAALFLVLFASPGLSQASPDGPRIESQRESGGSPTISAPADSLDAQITRIMAEHGTPGLALVVMKGDKVIKEGYYGMANLEHQVPVTRETSFEIASMTKPFTATAIMLLVEEGRVRLDDPVTRFIPEAPETWKAITLRRLLSHTAGLRDDWEHDWDEIPGFFMANQTDQQFLEEFFKRPLKFTPGEGFDYGAGTFVLGVVIERVTSRGYAEFMHERMFEPLGLSNTAVIDPYAIIPHRADGYIAWGERAERPWPWLAEASKPRGPLTRGLRISPAANARGDVGVRTTALELGKWIAALNTGHIVSERSLREMYTPSRLRNGAAVSTGLGWYSDYYRGRPAIWHAGAFRTGFMSMMEYYPTEELTIVLLQNFHDQGAAEHKLLRAVRSFYAPHMRPISLKPAARDPDPSRTERMLAVIQALAAGGANPNLMVENMQVAQNPWSDSYSKVASIGYVDCEDVSAQALEIFGTPIATLCYYRLNLGGDGDQEGRSVFTTFASTSDGRIAYVDWPERP